MRQSGASFISVKEGADIGGGARVEELKENEFNLTRQSLMSEEELREARLENQVGVLNEDIEEVARKIEKIRDLALRREQFEPHYGALL